MKTIDIDNIIDADAWHAEIIKHDIQLIAPHGLNVNALEFKQLYQKKHKNNFAQAIAKKKYDVYNSIQAQYEIHEFDCENKFYYAQSGISIEEIKKMQNIRKHSDGKNIATLDLHKYTLQQAYNDVHEFINLSYHYGQKYVKIIHGKGLSSANNQAVLKPKVLYWLTNITHVLAFVKANENKHDTSRFSNNYGASIVLLKNHEKYA
jgi:DNA-nicking Smr family endonuclease